MQSDSQPKEDENRTPLAVASLSAELIRICGKPTGAYDRRKAALLLTDWIGIAIAGSVTPSGQKIRSIQQVQSDAAKCSAIGLGRMSAEQAAFVNGSYGTLLEMDDLHRASLLHAGDVVIPAAIAAAQQVDASGARLLDAIIVGYEVALRIGQIAAKRGYSAWYNSGTCGIFGAAMAAAHSLGLTDNQKCDALGHAGMQASGLWQCRLEPTDSKCLATAHASRAGLTAALYAASGLRGPRCILEGDMGFLRTLYPGSDASVALFPHMQRLIHDVSFKPWPACRHVHPAIFAALELRHKSKIEAIKKISVETYAAGIAFCDNADPTTSHEARFSFQHAVATALLCGPPKLEHFTRDALSNGNLSTLRNKIVVVESPELTHAFPARTGAKLQIIFENNTQISCATQHAPGDPEQPLTPDEIRLKFETNVAQAKVSGNSSHRILSAIDGLLNDGGLGVLSRALDGTAKAVPQ